jgi:hypothetical protein
MLIAGHGVQSIQGLSVWAVQTLTNRKHERGGGEAFMVPLHSLHSPLSDRAMRGFADTGRRRRWLYKLGHLDRGRASELPGIRLGAGAIGVEHSSNVELVEGGPCETRTDTWSL